jgi:hypothetical protein
MKRVKNNTASVKTWCGQEIEAGQYYTIEVTEDLSWSNNNTVIVAISNAEAIMNNGTEDITDINKAIEFLKNNDPIEAITEYTSRYFLKADAVMTTAEPNAVTTLDLLIDNKTAESPVLNNESYVYKYLKGGTIFGEGFVLGDWAKFMVIDKDGWLVTTGQMPQNIFNAIKPVVLKEYVVKRYIHPTCAVTNNIVAEAPGKIPVGTYVRCELHTVNSGGTRTFVINYDINNKD